MMFFSRFESPYGIWAVMASEAGVRSVILPHEGFSASDKAGKYSALTPSGLCEQVASMLTNYFKGERQQFEIIPIDLDVAGSFTCRVLNLIRSIPYGSVKSYREVAILAGSPRSARAVGGAMAANPVPVIIPCHRVVSSRGCLTGYTAPGGLELKKILLQMEGVEFIGEHVCQAK